jgi:hypothetical protein
VKEDENDLAKLPDWPISPHRKFVTEEGLAAIEAALGCFEAAHRAATDKGDREAAVAALLEVRYWRARRASAEVVKPLHDKGTASLPSACAEWTDASRVSMVEMRPILRAARSPICRRSRGPF